MATRRYKISPGYRDEDIVEEVGAATNSNPIELTVDLATTTVNSARGGTRAVLKEEVLQALDQLKNHIVTGKWPPA